MRHTEYKTLFEGLVQRHKELQIAGATFSQMHLSANPLQQQLDLSEFFSTLRNKKGIHVVLQSFHSQYQDNGGDNRSRWLHGAILVLDKVPKDNWLVQGEVYDRTERIAEELMAAVTHQLNYAYKHLVDPSRFEGEKIGPVETFHGTRISFSIKQLSAPSLSFNPELFN